MPAMQVKGHVIVRTWLELEYVGMVGPARPGIKLSEDGQLDVQDVDQQRSVVLVGWIGSPWTKPNWKAVGRATKKRNKKGVLVRAPSSTWKEALAKSAQALGVEWESGYVWI